MKEGKETLHTAFSKRTESVVAVSLVLAVVLLLWVLYIPLLDSYFISDDYQCIWFSATKSLGQIFFSPEDYRYISGANFTPMVGVSFKIDWLLSGVNPEGYFIHQLISLLLAAAALYFFMRLYTPPLFACACVILFLLNPVVLSVFGWISTRHYIEGLFFALVSLILFVKADRDGRASVASGAFYLLSALCKEVYVLLPVVAYILSSGGLMQRIKKTVPLWGALALYTIWRLWMLSGVGGYPFGDSLGVTSILTGIYKILDKTSFHLFGNLHALFWPFIIVILLTAKEKKQAVTFTVMTIILLIPVVPVVNLLDVHFSWARYIFHFSVIILIFTILWAKGMIDQQGWKRLAVFPLLVLVAVLFINRDSELQATLSDESANARKTAEEFLNSGKDYIRSAQDTWFYDGLRDINEYFYGRKIDTKIISEREIKYISEERRSDILSHGYDLGDDPGKNFRRNVIDGTIRVDGYRIAWELGPYKTGRYIVLRGRHEGLYNYITYVNTSGQYLFGKYYPDGRPLVYYLKVAYQSPEGWESISDEYRIEIPGKSTIHLNRH